MFKTSRNNYFNQFENISDSEKTHTISHNEQPQIPKSKNSDKRPKWRNNNFVNLYVMTQMLTTVNCPNDTSLFCLISVRISDCRWHS